MTPWNQQHTKKEEVYAQHYNGSPTYVNDPTLAIHDTDAGTWKPKMPRDEGNPVPVLDLSKPEPTGRSQA